MGTAFAYEYKVYPGCPVKRLNIVSKLVDKFYKDSHANIFNFSYSVLAILLLITVGASYVFYTSARSKDVIRFTNETNRVQSAIENRIRIYIGLLNGGRGFIESTNNLDSRKFGGYADSLDLEKNYSGLRSLGFVKTVRAGDIGILAEKMAFEGYPEFHIFPEVQKAEYQALVYVEPFDDRSRKGIGLDFSSEPVRTEALERAKNTGRAAASGKLIPIISPEENGTQARIVIFLPVYGESLLAGDYPERSGNIQGYIYGAFIVENFLAEINKEVGNKDVSLKIYDAADTPENLLADTREQLDSGFISIPNEIYTRRTEFEVAGRPWVINYRSMPSFITGSSLGWTPLILICGILVSFVLFGMTYWEASARVKLQQTAAELFETQKEKEKLYEEEQKSRQTAERANAAKDEFIAIISHELKTPLNAIAGWARILKTHNVTEETKNTALQKIDKNLRTQAGLVEQLLTYSDIISGNIGGEEKQVNFSALVEETLSEMEPVAHEKNIVLLRENKLNGEVVAGDTDQLKIVLECLLKNAVKFTEPGGQIDTSLTRLGGMVQFTVKDSGRGISSDFMPYIFDQYRQADTPNIRDYGGLGLGLTISRYIVGLHGGKIEAASEGKGKGSVFTLQLPCKTLK
jgi:signal transduction histidine kinase